MHLLGVPAREVQRLHDRHDVGSAEPSQPGASLGPSSPSRAAGVFSAAATRNRCRRTRLSGW